MMYIENIKKRERYLLARQISAGVLNRYLVIRDKEK